MVLTAPMVALANDRRRGRLRADTGEDHEHRCEAAEADLVEKSDDSAILTDVLAASGRRLFRLSQHGIGTRCHGSPTVVRCKHGASRLSAPTTESLPAENAARAAVARSANYGPQTAVDHKGMPAELRWS